MLVVVLGGGIYLYSVWASIEQLDFDPEAAEELEASRPTVDPSFFDSDEVFDDITTTTSTTLDLEITEDTTPPEPEVPDIVSTTTTTVPDLPPPPTSGGRGDLVGYLIGGSDNAPSIGSADTIYLAVKGSGTVLYSVPRSLYIPNPCTGEPVRAALLLRGCPGSASGPTLLARGLSEFTGVPISGFATVSYTGFVEIVNALGGITICSDTPRGRNGNVIVPAGCNLLDGNSAAWWVRSRSQNELVDGEWRAVSGDDAQSRSARQSKAFSAVISRVLSFSSASSLVSVANQVPGTFALGGMSVGEAANLAMSMRGGYHIAGIPTESRVTAEGTWVLYPTEPFSSTLGRNGQ